MTRATSFVRGGGGRGRHHAPPTSARRSLVARAALFVLAAGVAAVTVSSPATASVTAGVAEITVPGAATPLNSGGSATPYGLALPAEASCPGDTAHKGYHVFSYLVRQGVSPASVAFTDLPKEGLGYFSAGVYVGALNTAENTGEIVKLPAEYSWTRLTASLLFTGGETSATWDGGIACVNVDGVVTDYWNTEIVFRASTTDPAGFTWSVVAPASSSGGSVPWLGIVLLVAAVVLAGTAVELRRRRVRERQHVDH